MVLAPLHSRILGHIKSWKGRSLKPSTVPVAAAAYKSSCDTPRCFRHFKFLHFAAKAGDRIGPESVEILQISVSSASEESSVQCGCFRALVQALLQLVFLLIVWHVGFQVEIQGFVQRDTKYHVEKDFVFRT